MLRPQPAGHHQVTDCAPQVAEVFREHIDKCCRGGHNVLDKGARCVWSGEERSYAHPALGYARLPGQARANDPTLV